MIARILCALLTRLYPTAFRREHGVEFRQFVLTLFASSRSRWSILRLLLADLVTSLPREWWLTLKANRGLSHRFDEPAKGKPMWNLVRDVQYAVRLLVRAPGFTAAAVLTLALAIGANAAFFSLAESTILRPLKVRDAERLVAIGWSSAYLDYVEYSQRRDLFTDVFATGGPNRINLVVDGASQLASATFLSGNTFSALGVLPEAGRVLQPSDDAGTGGPVVAVLSHKYWSSRFGKDPAVAGKAVMVNGTPATIVGVAAKGFRGTSLSSAPDLFMPVTSVRQVRRTGFFATENPLTNRGFSWLIVTGRLQHGVTAAQAAAALDAMYQRLHPSSSRGKPLSLEPLAVRAFERDNVEAIRRFVLLLVGVVALTLFIGCANLANLLLARAAARRHEIGVRMALGASRGSIARQLMVESLVLATFGGASALVVAHLMLKLLSSYQLPGGIEIANLGLALDTRTALAVAGLTLLTALLFGAIPAWSAGAGDLAQSLRGQGRVSARVRLRGALVAAQVALSLVLLAGTGLFLRSLVHALNTPLGYEPDRVATASVNLGLARYTDTRATEFYERALASIQAIPDVGSAAWGTLIPTNGTMVASMQIDGYAPATDEQPRMYLSQVGPAYFQTVGTRILNGRAFDPGDNASAPRVAIVNEAAALKYWAGRNPLGGRLRMDEGEPFTVIGVAENSTIARLGEDPFPYVFFAFAQDIGFGALTAPAHIFARTSGDPARLLPALRVRLQTIDAHVPVFDLEPLSAHVQELVMPQRMGSTLFGCFSVLALSLAVIGVYGVASYLAGLRTREIGIRVALGADARSIRRLLIAEGAGAVLAGIALGVVLALWSARFATAFVYDVSPWDPATFIAVTLVLALLALLANALPARKVARIDPVRVLRHD